MSPRYKNKTYSLFAVKRKSGYVWHYQTYIDGKRTCALSTGMGYKTDRDKAKTRREAVSFCDELEKTSALLPCPLHSAAV